MPKIGYGIVIYGEPGIGKTSFALQFPKPLVCVSAKENGYKNLEAVGDVPEGCSEKKVISFEELMGVCKRVEARTLVIDSLSGLQQLVNEYVVQSIYNGDTKKFGAFYDGPKNQVPLALSHLEVLLSSLREEGTNVLLIAHSIVDKSVSATGADSAVNTLAMDSWSRPVFLKWAQAVLYMKNEMQVEMVAKMYKQTVTLVKPKEGESTRMIYTQKSPGHDAKNTMKLQPYINMGASAEEAYKNFQDALPTALKQ